MTSRGHPAAADALERFRQFLAGQTSQRLFRHPIEHPALPTGFCFCDEGSWATVRMCLRGALLELALRLPFNELKLKLLRRLGAKIGKNVYISAGTWIDPVYPQLLTIEDTVFIGMGARITLHEYRIDEFRAGPVILRRGCFVGGHALIGCGIEIGEGAVVAAGAAVARDVPPGATALGNPARIVRGQRGDATPGSNETAERSTEESSEE